MKGEWKEKWEKIKNGKMFRIFIIALCVAVLLIALIDIFAPKKTSSTSADASAASEYVLKLEEDLENTLSKIEGVGKVNVMVTVDGGIETIIAKETTTVKNPDGTEKVVETPVLVGGKVVVLKEVYPPVTGIIVVAKGAKNIMVMRNIQTAVITLTGVSLDKLQINEMN